MVALVLMVLSSLLAPSAHAETPTFIWRVRCETQPVGFDRYTTIVMGDIDLGLAKDGKLHGWLRDGTHWTSLKVDAQFDKVDTNYRHFSYSGEMTFEKNGHEKHRRYSGRIRVYMPNAKDDATVLEVAGAEEVCEPGLFGECEWRGSSTTKPFRAYCK